jgi:hypothetical protein
VNVFPNHKLLAKVYPRLLRSYALQAAVENDKGQTAATLSCDDVSPFMKELQGKDGHESAAGGLTAAAARAGRFPVTHSFDNFFNSSASFSP